MLNIVSIRLRNYRTYDDCTIPLRPKTVILGANNVGKTSLLEAIENALGAGRRGYGFTEGDIKEGTPQGTKITVELVIHPKDSYQFNTDEHAIFGTCVDVYDGNREQLLLRIEAGHDEGDGIFRSRARFYKNDDVDDGVVTSEHRKALAVLLMQASRDARRELHDRFGLWARITSTLELEEEQEEHLRSLGEEMGQTVVSELLSGLSSADQLTTIVSELLSHVFYGKTATPSVVFSTTPFDLRQLLRQIEIGILSPGDQRARSLVDVSVGTQSVALFGLFRAYLSALQYQLLAIGVEEPEVHLFPHAVRSLVKSIRSLDVQTLVTTHSTAVTDLADPRDFVVLRRHGDRTIAAWVPEGQMTDDQAKEIRRKIRAAGSGFVFARAILFSEGPSEELALPLFAEQLGLDFDSLGVSLVAVEGSSFQAFSRLLHPRALNIPHLIVCDNDGAVRQLIQDLAKAGSLPAGVDPLNPQGSRSTLEAAGYHWWSAGDFESCLLAEGGLPFYQQAISDIYGNQRLASFEPQLTTRLGHTPTDKELVLNFIRAPRTSKPKLAQRVAELFGESGHAVPAEIRSLLETIAKVAQKQMEVVSNADLAAQPG